MNKNKGGRPIEWTKERKDIAKKYILQRMEEGLSVRKILANKEKDLPHRSILNDWVMYDDDGFTGLYVKAKAAMCAQKCDLIDQQADELVEKAYNKEIDMIIINAVRHKADVVKWSLSKLMPKKYGSTLNLDSDATKEIKNIEISFSKPLKTKK